MPITSYLYDSTGTDRPVALSPELIAGLHDKQLLWVDITSVEGEETARLRELLSLRRDSMRFLLTKGARPRLTDYGHYSQLNINAIEKVDGTIRLNEVDFIIRPNLIVTFHREPVSFLENFDDSRKSDTDLGTLDSESFLAGLLDWHITGYFRIVEELEKEIDKLDAKALMPYQRQDLLLDMSKLRQSVAFIRRSLTPHREVYTGLLRREFQERKSAEDEMLFPILNERLEIAIDAVENARELLIGSFDMFTTRTTMKTNEVIKALTLFSFVWVPASVVVGISTMLMKTPVSPVENVGFWAMMACIILIAVATVVFARIRRWI
ncbi:MAG: CorA family divalent cation transporter [Pseudomonadota bacterium]|nr:CorA family divalent cation transporter [Pseudomonadota bacterium]